MIWGIGKAPETGDQVTFFVKSSLTTSLYNNWNIFSHSKPLFKNLEKLHPYGLKLDPDLTLPHIHLSKSFSLKLVFCEVLQLSTHLEEVPKFGIKVQCSLNFFMHIFSCITVGHSIVRYTLNADYRLQKWQYTLHSAECSACK